ncbi:hypothetical protein H8356DRAFT_1648157 [Neocallimastix lanati (nom. inval.)]|nr:hypothetical protein H8356DRAFT_1648157 [Neocallimastix sp. JGI-2020a]
MSKVNDGNHKTFYRKSFIYIFILLIVWFFSFLLSTHTRVTLILEILLFWSPFLLLILISGKKKLAYIKVYVYIFYSYSVLIILDCIYVIIYGIINQEIFENIEYLIIVFDTVLCILYTYMLHKFLKYCKTNHQSIKKEDGSNNENKTTELNSSTEASENRNLPNENNDHAINMA